MPRTIKSNTNDRTSIFTNTFFKICGFAKFDRFDDFMKRLLDISKEFHFVFLFIMIKTSIFTNTFFKICGFGRVDRFDDFLKCMLDISKWYDTDRYRHIDDMQNEHVVWHCAILRVHTDMSAPWVHSTWTFVLLGRLERYYLPVRTCMLHGSIRRDHTRLWAVWLDCTRP